MLCFGVPLVSCGHETARKTQVIINFDEQFRQFDRADMLAEPFFERLSSSRFGCKCLK
jgi:hypothetical protein